MSSTVSGLEPAVQQVTNHSIVKNISAHTLPSPPRHVVISHISNPIAQALFKSEHLAALCFYLQELFLIGY